MEPILVQQASCHKSCLMIKEAKILLTTQTLEPFEDNVGSPNPFIIFSAAKGTEERTTCSSDKTEETTEHCIHFSPPVCGVALAPDAIRTVRASASWRGMKELVRTCGAIQTPNSRLEGPLISFSFILRYPPYLRNWEQGVRLHLQDILITTTNRAGILFSAERAVLKETQRSGQT